MPDKNNAFRLKEYVQKINWKLEIKNITLLLLGAFLAGTAINLIYIPISISMGGVSGLAQIIHLLLGQNRFFTLGTLSMFLNIPILLVGWKFYGFRMVYRSLIGTFVFSFMIDFTASFMEGWYAKMVEGIEPTPDKLIFAIFGGVLFGIGLGMIFRGHYTTGGSDILAVLASKFLHHITIGQFIFAFDVLVISLHVITSIFKQSAPDYMSALYAFVALFLTSKITDTVLTGTDSSQACFIISSKSEAIADEILTKMNRGATGLDGRGMFTRTEKEILLVVLSVREVPDLKKLVRSIDDKAFLIVTDAKEVAGEGFGREDLI